MAIPALLTIDGRDCPEPSEYSASTSTLVDSGRNVEGKVIGSVVRHGVSKVEVQWRYLSILRTKSEDPATGEVMGWVDCGFSLVEV